MGLMIGGYAVLKFGGGQAGILRTWGKYIATSAATFGYPPLRHETFQANGIDFSWYEMAMNET
jgi:hypothetical protein